MPPLEYTEIELPSYPLGHAVPTFCVDAVEMDYILKVFFKYTFEYEGDNVRKLEKLTCIFLHSINFIVVAI